MFFIVNTTKGIITLGDLKISLGPHQAIDLDRAMEREKANKSIYLQRAIAKGDIKVKRKDEPPKEVQVIETRAKVDMDSIKDEILGEMKNNFQDMATNLKEQINVKPEITSNDVDQMMQLLQQLKDQGQNIVIQQVDKLASTEEVVEVDEKILTDIHTRAVNKLTEKSKARAVSYKEESVKDDLDDNIDELGKLL